MGSPRLYIEEGGEPWPGTNTPTKANWAKEYGRDLEDRGRASPVIGKLTAEGAP